MDLDDETPPGPRAPSSPEARALVDVQLALLALAADSGRAAARIDAVPEPDRADVVALYRRRVGEVKGELDGLLELLGS